MLIVTSLDFTAYAAENTASTMKLKKTEGTVNVSGSTGKALPILENMNLYSGYSVGTMEQSYAWVDLDTSKLIKLDAVTEAGIRKHGKKLEVILSIYAHRLLTQSGAARTAQQVCSPDCRLRLLQ